MSQNKIPSHVAIIMDGNGRWAENQGLPRLDGHRAGLEKAKLIVQSCLHHQISILSLFAFGYENWARPEAEVHFLMGLLLQVLGDEVHQLHHHGVLLRFTGMRNALPQALQDAMTHAELLTKDNNRLTLNIVFNYSGRQDIVHAVKTIAEKVQKGSLSIQAIDESLLSQHMSTYPLPHPDLFIRTSGELRVSNFFLWELAYTEFYFTPIKWPDFDDNEFQKALDSFKQRERRYGKTSHQLSEISDV